MFHSKNTQRIREMLSEKGIKLYLKNAHIKISKNFTSYWRQTLNSI